MKKTSILLLLVFSIVLGFWGCNAEKPAVLTDTEAPEITISHPMMTSQAGPYSQYQNNDDIHLDVRFEDDVELDNYLVEVRYAKDLYFLKTNNDAWETTLMGDLDGMSDGLNTTIGIRNDPSAGPYELKFTVTDMAGRVSVKSTYVYIWNDRDTILPVVTISLPDTSDVDTFTIGSNINVKGVLSDPGGVMVDGFVRIKDVITLEEVPGTRITFDTLNLSTYSFNLFISAPVGTPEGDYVIEAYGRDPINNYSGAKSFIYLR